MSIDLLLQGRLHGNPRERMGKNGRPFVTCTIRSATRDGSAVFASVISFSATACRTLMALAEGDSVAVSGECTPKVYIPEGGEPRASLDVVAHAVLTEYAVQRKRRAVVEAKPSEQPQTEGQRSSEPELDDALPF